MACLLASLSVGCGDFESKSIVLDLRILAINADPPEVVADFDPDNPENTDLPDVELCALVADPGESRSLRYNMVACPPRNDGRCSDPNQPFIDIGFGTVEDPEEASSAVQICQTLVGSPALAPVIEASISVDNLSGFGGIPIQVEFWTMPDGGTFPDDAVFGVKEILFAPRIPDQRVQNTNPHLDEIKVTRLSDESETTLPLGRCGEVTPLEVSPGEEIELLPVEPEGVREDYVVPTFDGDVRYFTENMRYAWFATAGEWSPENTGGPKDNVGNEPKLESKWTAPEDADEIGTGLDVRMWIVMRDERGGNAWYESCVHVAP
jgi:hypothetical protein